MATDYFSQAVNFHFSVGFTGDDVKFQSVSGLDSTIETEIIKEGGENRFSHVVPVRRKYGPLILKRGILKPKPGTEGGVTKWLQDAFEHEYIKPKDSLVIQLLSEDHKTPLMNWTITNVWPLSWKIGELNAEQGAILIETLELSYNVLLMDSMEKYQSREGKEASIKDSKRK